MDPEAKASERDEDSRSSELSSVEDVSDLDNSDSEAPAPVEWLATGRQRRATAGNRMKSMLANEEPDSDMELLFAEDENDQGFSDADENASDVQMDSSSDDEDDNNAADDDLEGERELEKQAKERRAAQRKRKAQEHIPAKFRKKVRIDTTATTPTSSRATPSAPRPKKKSERASWLPSAADMPTRASSRQTTRLSKEQLHAQMEERERKRLKQLAQMEKKAARLEALKKLPMTQEDRLREAAEVEERNSKSLNRGEEAEKQREEERRAKLAALHERKLRGPVITFWSGMGRFGDGWLKSEGINVVVEEKPKKQKKEKAPKEPKGKKKALAQAEAEAEKEKEKEKAAGVNGAPSETVPKTEPQGDATSKTADAPTAESTTNGEAKIADSTSKEEPAMANGEVAAADVAMTDAPAVTEEAAAKTQEGEKPQETDAAQNGEKAQGDDSQGTEKQARTDTATTEPPQNGTSEAVTAPSETPAEKTAETTAGAPTEEESAKKTPEKPQEPQEATKEAEQIKKEDVDAVQTPNDKPAEAKGESKLESQGEGGEKPSTPAEASKDAAPTTAGPEAIATTVPTTNGAETNGTVNSTANGPQPTTSDTTTAPAPQNPPPNAAENDPSKPASQIQSENVTPQPTEPKNPMDGHSTTRNAIIYQNFDENAIRDRTTQTQILFGRKMGRLPSTFFTNLYMSICNGTQNANTSKQNPHHRPSAPLQTPPHATATQ